MTEPSAVPTFKRGWGRGTGKRLRLVYVTPPRVDRMTDYDEQSVQIAVTVKGQADAEKALEQAQALLDQFHPKAQVGDILLVRDDLRVCSDFG
jgi:hypothetical protein